MSDAIRSPSSRDVSARADNTRATAASLKDWLFALVDSSTDAIISITPDGIVVSWNPSAERLFGYTQAEIIGQSIAILHPPERAEDLGALLTRFERGEPSPWHETERLNKAGIRVRVAIMHSAIRDSQGRLVSICGLIRDYTERNQQAEQIRFQAQLLEMVDRAVIATDLEGRIRFWNRYAEQLYGWAAPEIVGRPILEVTPSDISRAQAIDIMAALQQGNRWAGEFWVQRRDGQRFLAEVTDSPIVDEHGQLIGIVGVSHDISERKQLEQELERRVVERTAQWQTASEELRRLAVHLQRAREDERASIARDLHDDLGQVVSMVKLELSLLARKLVKDPQSFMAAPNDALLQLDAMQAMLDESLQSIRAMIKQLRPDFLGEVGLPMALAWQAEQFQTRSKIPCQFTTDVAEFAGDPNRALALFRIVQESLTNIARHAQATRVEVSLHQTDAQLLLEVRDNGRGISPEELQKQDHFGVLGMRERVIGFGGEFTISGSPGQGTTVSVRMPVDQTEVWS